MNWLPFWWVMVSVRIVYPGSWLSVMICSMRALTLSLMLFWYSRQQSMRVFCWVARRVMARATVVLLPDERPPLKS